MSKRDVGRPLKGDQKRMRASFTIDPAHLAWIKGRARSERSSASDVLDQLLAMARLKPGRRFRVFADLREIAEICERHGVSRMSLFGSVLTDRFTESSDVDVLVEFRKGIHPGFFELSGLQSDLSKAFGGRQVDLRTAGELSRLFRDEVLFSSTVIYAA